MGRMNLNCSDGEESDSEALDEPDVAQERRLVQRGPPPPVGRVDVAEVERRAARVLVRPQQLVDDLGLAAPDRVEQGRPDGGPQVHVERVALAVVLVLEPRGDSAREPHQRVEAELGREGEGKEREGARG